MIAVPEAPAYAHTRLDNGVRVVTEHIPSVRSVAVGAWLDVGSRDEAPEEAGMAHFIEHMVFKGTQRRRSHHINQRMEAVGGYLNAFTSKESTCYYARGLDEHLKRALDTVLDLVVRPVFPERELEKEKEVVLEEMKMYADQPEDYVFDLYEAALYPNDPLGRPVIGRPETVSAFSRDDVRGFVERTYTPDRLVVAVAGHVKHERVVRAVERLTSDFDRAPSASDRAPVSEYAPTRHTATRPIQQAHLVVGTRGIGLLDPRRTVVSVLNTVLGGGMSSRLNQNIRERYGYCYSIYSFANMMREAGDFGVYVGVDPSRVDRAETLIRRELEKMASSPVSARALDRAKAQLKGSMMLGLESMSNRMMRLGRVELTFGQHFSLDTVTAEIDAVTAEDVRTVSEALFDPEALSVVSLVPA